MNREDKAKRFREGKVKRLLEGLENYLDDKCGMFYHSCVYRECPYAEVDNCLQEMLKDARALLTPEPPRLVTREDFQQPPAYDGVLPCWKESRSKTRRNGWAAIVYGKALQDIETGVARYWTGVPTDEQKEGTPWPSAENRDR